MDYHKFNTELLVAMETKETLTYSIFSIDLNGDTKRRTIGKERHLGGGNSRAHGEVPRLPMSPSKKA